MGQKPSSARNSTSAVTRPRRLPPVESCPTPIQEAAGKSFSDNNLSWHSRPQKMVGVGQNRKQPSMDGISTAITSSAASSSLVVAHQPTSGSTPVSSKPKKARPSSSILSIRLFSITRPELSAMSASTVAVFPVKSETPPEAERRQLPDKTAPMCLSERFDDDEAVLTPSSADITNAEFVESAEKVDDNLKCVAINDNCRAVIGKILRHTVDFLVHEIEPILIAEYLKHQRRSRRQHGAAPQSAKNRKSNGGVVAAGNVIRYHSTVSAGIEKSPSSPTCMTELELRQLIGDIILGPGFNDDENESPPADAVATDGDTSNVWSAEEEFWMLCRLLRKFDAERKSGEFLEALGIVLKTVTPCQCCQCACHTCSSYSSMQSRNSSNSSSPSLHHDRGEPYCNGWVPPSPAFPDVDNTKTNGSLGKSYRMRRRRHQIDVDIIYADSETRALRPFDDVAQLKRCRRRKSRIGAASRDKAQEKLQGTPAANQRQLDQPNGPSAVVVRDTSDRYVPMLSIQVSNVGAGLCESRTRRLERLLEVFPDRLRDLSVIDTELNPASLLRLGRAIQLNTGLYSLDLHRAGLGNDGTTLLVMALANHTGLRSLGLSGNGITRSGCQILVRSLLSSSAPVRGRLYELDLSDNLIGDAGCRMLADVLKETVCQLRRLSVRRNGIGPAGAREVFLALKRNTRLASLDISENSLVRYDDDLLNRINSQRKFETRKTAAEKIEECGGGSCDKGAALVDLCTSLIVNRTLRNIWAENCGLTDVECFQLARPLRTNTILRQLHFNNNPAIGDGGAEHLADGLRYNHGLHTLGISGCSVENVGLSAFIEASRFNSTVKLIDLRRQCKLEVDHHTPSDLSSECSESLQSPISDGAFWRASERTKDPPELKPSGKTFSFSNQLVEVAESFDRPKILLD